MDLHCSGEEKFEFLLHWQKTSFSAAIWWPKSICKMIKSVKTMLARTSVLQIGQTYVLMNLDDTNTRRTAEHCCFCRPQPMVSADLNYHDSIATSLPFSHPPKSEMARPASGLVNPDLVHRLSLNRWSCQSSQAQPPEQHHHWPPRQAQLRVWLCSTWYRRVFVDVIWWMLAI